MGETCPTCGKEYASEHGVKVHHKAKHDESLGGFNHTCEICGEEFTHRSSERKYCSRDCFGKGHSKAMSGESHPNWKGKVECTCEMCGATHYKPPSKADRPYCSQECSGKAVFADSPEDNPFYKGGTKEEIQCKECGVSFEAFEVIERQFCSTTCHDKWQVGKRTGEDSPCWAGGEYPYGPGWNESKKEKVRERDNRECQQCGRGEEEHKEKYGCRHEVHHIRKAREFDDPENRNAVENLVTLCKGECHKKWERCSPLRPA